MILFWSYFNIILTLYSNMVINSVKAFLSLNIKDKAKNYFY